MADFNMCENCAADYHDPLNRRFHAQPIACNNCGPQLSHTIDEIIKNIQAGKILAIKGLGGYQLVCDVYNDKAVSNLRLRKGREAKPFAVMVADIASASAIAKCTTAELNLLAQPTRSIVLVAKHVDAQLAASVAPGLSTFGVMLPYTPLHYLLFNKLKRKQAAALIVTSACELLGLDPLYVANEGKLVAICKAEDAELLLNVMQKHPLGKHAAIIGEVVADPNYFVQMKTSFGGRRMVDWLAGEQLPRIC